MITEIRAGFRVRRFHTSVRLQEETVGHHSANVCAILYRLKPSVSRELILFALFHDVAEVYTGDVPAPFKWDNPDIAAGLQAGEGEYFRKHDIPAPTEHEELTREDLKLLKLADMLDLVLSSIEDRKRGNVYAGQLVDNGITYINHMNLDEKTASVVQQMIAEVDDER